MRKIVFSITAILIASITACSSGQTSKTTLEAKEFQAKINNTENAVILDVRTPEEFNEGHLANSTNINWNDSDAEIKLKGLDPTKTYFVYCLSGGRSSGAANFLRENGFKEVYELAGGIMKWRSASLPEENTSTESSVKSDELNTEAYEALLKNDKTVVIDFYAEWCAPCKKMGPYLTEMQNTMSDKVVIIRIDADKNPNLCKSLQVDALPTIYVYKGNEKTFQHIGFLSKEELLKEL